MTCAQLPQKRRSRLRPILMTSMMAALGLLPGGAFARGGRRDGAVLLPLSSAAGLVTPLTLLVLPVAMTFLLAISRHRPVHTPELAAENG